MHDAIVVGAGPAGVSASIWLKQLGFDPLLVDKNDRCGGLQLSNPYTNTWIATSAGVYGKDVAQAMHDNVERFAVQTLLGSEVAHARPEVDGSFTVSVKGRGEYHAKTIVLVGGVVPKTGGYAARLGMMVGPGPKIAASDFAGKSVAILGGGDSSFENYTFVRERGAAKVQIYARTLRARAEMLHRVPASDVVVGDAVVNSEANTVNGERYDVILVLYGYQPNAASLVGLEPMLKPDGFVWTGPECETSIDGVYAVGEIARRAHPCCATAMADGVVAAKAIQRRLESSVAAQYLGMARRFAGLAGAVFS